jgi:hypothetical protein
MDAFLFRTFSHMIIMTQRGARILIKDISIKVKDMHRDSGKA